MQSKCAAQIHANKLDSVSWTKPIQTHLPTDEAEELKRARHATVCALSHHTNEMNMTFRAGEWRFLMSDMSKI